MTTETNTTATYIVDDLPGRGDRLVHEGRTYVINETSLAVKDGLPDGTEWVGLFGEDRNGVLVVLLRAIEVKGVDHEEPTS